MEKMLAIDLGASSGKAILGRFEKDRFDIEEIARFDNEPVFFARHLHWDILRLCFNIKQILLECRNRGETVVSLGIDTWGVDFGLLDKNGELLANPYHYRDQRTDRIMERCFSIIPENELFEKTGIGSAQYNTIYQLLAMKEEGDVALANAHTLLMMPDLINYMLTGRKAAEYTEATTTQLYDCIDKDWCEELIGRLGIPETIFPQLIQPGTKIGLLREDICAELGIDKMPVIAVGSHDTASAITAVPATEDFIYISTGTWLIIGIESEKPFTGPTEFQHKFSNEGGCGSKVNFQRNLMGLWLVQECRRQWENEGIEIEFGEMVALASKAQSNAIIDPDDDSFYAPVNMVRSIEEFCRKTDQPIPETKGELLRCIEESLALKCRWIIERIEDITGRMYPVVHMFGGGIRDELLCQMISDANGREVIAGPVEATAIGNLLMQAICLGKIEDIGTGRRMVKTSFECKTYLPKGKNDWEEKYRRFLKILSLNRST